LPETFKMSAKLVVLSSVVAAAAAMPIAENLHDRAYYEEKFFNWLSEHKVQARNGEHFAKMIQNFANNDDFIANHNGQKLGFELGHNQFSHLSLDEWREYVGLGLARPMNPLEAAEIHAAPADVSTLAGSIDWRTKGAVTPVKDQGQCGSCWSFSATGAMEGAYKNKYGVLQSFSEQNFVDCDNRANGGSDLGCNGGLMDSAFSWAKKNGGICTEAGYPYVSGTTKTAGTCQKTCSKVANSAPISYVDVQINSDSAMMSALNLNPVSVAIEADTREFQLYKSGVFTAACGTNLDHGVLAVGYGTEGTQDYYLVKNSWGTSWGDQGYIKMAKGISQKQGQCGILSGPPSYPKF
jgi:C1A family cysteine protease